MNRRCFIAISTGQSIANVAPLLAVAQPTDLVVFVETRAAVQGQWTMPVREVLARHGIQALQTISIDSDAAEQIYRSVKAYRWPEGEKTIIGNGGTKLQFMAILSALADTPTRIVYSLDRPCALEWYDDRFAAPCKQEPYVATRLSLEDVLALRAMKINEPGEVLYADGGLTPAGRDRAAMHGGYGFDADISFAIHDQHMRLAADERGRALPERLPRWPDLLVRAPDAAARFARALSSTLAMDPNALGVKDPRCAQMFNTAVRAMSNASKVTDRSNDGHAVPSLGMVFERALTVRLCRMLAQGQIPSQPLQSMHSNVKIEKKANPGITVLEADVLFLLKNGLVLALEAKSHTADLKDLDARLLNLQKAGSMLARVIVCSPLYTDAVDRLWFHAHHELAERLRQDGFGHIALTLPGQRPAYTWPNDARGEAKTIQVPVFEQKIRDMFALYAVAEQP